MIYPLEKDDCICEILHLNEHISVIRDVIWDEAGAYYINALKSLWGFIDKFDFSCIQYLSGVNSEALEVSVCVCVYYPSHHI